MSEHVLESLGAFLDGELGGGQLRKVELHLEVCRTCMEEYQALGSLSAVLHAAPQPDFPSPERLAADVILRLPRNPGQPMSKKALEFSWWMAPVGLILAWIFISTTLLISDMVTTANGFGLLDSTSAWLVAGSSSEVTYAVFLGQLGLFGSESQPWLLFSESFARNFYFNVYWQVSVSMLYLSWMAIWWARHTQKGLGQPFENGRMPTVK